MDPPVVKEKWSSNGSICLNTLKPIIIKPYLSTKNNLLSPIRDSKNPRKKKSGFIRKYKYLNSSIHQSEMLYDSGRWEQHRPDQWPHLISTQHRVLLAYSISTRKVTLQTTELMVQIEPKMFQMIMIINYRTWLLQYTTGNTMQIFAELHFSHYHCTAQQDG